MRDYRVTWEIDLTAESPLDAAEQARRIQLNPSSLATAFVITGQGGRPQLVDLAEELVEYEVKAWITVRAPSERAALRRAERLADSIDHDDAWIGIEGEGAVHEVDV